MRIFLQFLKDIIIERRMIYNLAKNDLKARFSSSFLGVIWAILLPLSTILVLWFVFQIGLRSAPVEDVAFIVWLMPAYLVWNFILDAITGPANSIVEYQYLVKKINFKVNIIPIVKIVSSLIIHLFFIIFIIAINFFYGILPSIFYLQVCYYLFALFALLAGISWVLSALVPFIPDVLSVTNVMLQIGFWSTPIVWNAELMSPSIQLIIRLNPFFYICEGYRDSFTKSIWFWEKGWINIYYWGIVLLFFVIGTYIFHKLRPQFGDVL